MAEELKPCPFCGGDASAEGYVRYTPALADTWWPDGTVITDAFYVNCMNCGAVSRSGLTSGYQTRAEAIAAWNTRHSIPPTDEQEGMDLAKHLISARGWIEELADQSANQKKVRGILARIDAVLEAAGHAS